MAINTPCENAKYECYNCPFIESHDCIDYDSRTLYKINRKPEDVGIPDFLKNNDFLLRTLIVD